MLKAGEKTTPVFTPAQVKFIHAYRGSVESAAKIAGVSYSYGIMLSRDPKILAAIRAREQTHLAPYIMTKAERQGLLTEFAQDSNIDKQHRLRAIDQLSKIAADYAVDINVNHSVTVADIVAAATDPGPQRVATGEVIHQVTAEDTPRLAPGTPPGIAKVIDAAATAQPGTTDEPGALRPARDA